MANFYFLVERILFLSRIERRLIHAFGHEIIRFYVNDSIVFVKGPRNAILLSSLWS